MDNCEGSEEHWRELPRTYGVAASRRLSGAHCAKSTVMRPTRRGAGQFKFSPGYSFRASDSKDRQLGTSRATSGNSKRRSLPPISGHPPLRQIKLGGSNSDMLAHADPQYDT